MQQVSGFVRGRSLRFSALVALAALGALVVLAVSMSQRGDAAYSGLNGRIAYSLGDSAYNTAIWSANPDGSAPAQLTAGPSDFAPAYSANGSRIAFDRADSLVVMNADGSGQTVIFTGSSSHANQTTWQSNYQDPHSVNVIPFVKIETFTSSWNDLESPSFSPDGTQLAVSHPTGTRVQTRVCAVAAAEEDECIGYSEPGAYSNFENKCVACSSSIVTVSSTTGAITGTVTAPSSTLEDGDPTYSASGQIAFTRWDESGSRIFVVGSPGAPPVAVSGGHDDFSPDFSPDGSKIVFVHGGRELGLVGSGGGPVTVLPVPLPAGAKYSSAESPAFSPDGTRIAFHLQASTAAFQPIGTGLYTMGTDGSAVTAVVSGGAYSPSWQPVPPPPPPPPPAPPVPPQAVSPKGKVKLDKHGKAAVGTIVCGSSPCTLKLLSAKLKAGKKKFGVGASLPKSLQPGKKAKLEITVKGKGLAALIKAKKGQLVANVNVTDATGKKSLTLKSTLLPPTQKNKGKKKGK